MAKWSFAKQVWTPVAVADTVNFTDGGYMGLMGGSTTQRMDIYEVQVEGQETTATKPTFMVLGRDSTVQGTPTALTTNESNGPLDPATAALAAAQIAFTASTTKPQRSSSAARITLSFNAYGGIAKWQAYDANSGFKMVGNAATNGESSLSCFTGGTPGPVAAHILYETY